MLPSASQVEAIVAKSQSKEDHELARDFSNEDKSHPQKGWDLLSQIFNFHFQPHSTDEPFRPMAIFDGRRSMIPDDLTEEQLKDIAELLAKSSEPEVVARLADILWIRRKDVTAARAAVKAYLDSGLRIEDVEHWVGSMERYERGIRIARQIDPKGNTSLDALAFLEKRLFAHENVTSSYFGLKIIELLAEFGFGDYKRQITILGQGASTAEKSGDFRKARLHLDLQAKIYAFHKEQEEAETSLVASAKLHVKEAEADEANNSYMAARVNWEAAANAFQNRPSLRSEIPTLKKRLAEAGEKTLSEMKSHSVEIDLSEQISAAQKAVGGLSKEDAFFTWMLRLASKINPDKLRAEAIQQIKDHPLMASIDAAYYDEAGRKIGVSPSAVTDDPAQYEQAVIGFMEQNARFYRGPAVHGALAPALDLILKEHTYSDADINELIGDSPFIVDARRDYFLQGVMAGLQWDFATALHILVPQAENSLREMLRQDGVVPANVDKYGVEEVWSFERVLKHELVRKRLGNKLHFELWSLLVERLGPNLRNLIAHGLIAKGVLNGETGFYLWWILLQVIALPSTKCRAYIDRSVKQAKTESEGVVGESKNP